MCVFQFAFKWQQMKTNQFQLIENDEKQKTETKYSFCVFIRFKPKNNCNESHLNQFKTNQLMKLLAIKFNFMESHCLISETIHINFCIYICFLHSFIFTIYDHVFIWMRPIRTAK